MLGSLARLLGLWRRWPCYAAAPFGCSHHRRHPYLSSSSCFVLTIPQNDRAGISLAVDRGSRTHFAPGQILGQGRVVEDGGDCPYNVWSKSLWAVACRFVSINWPPLSIISKDAGTDTEEAQQGKPPQSAPDSVTWNARRPTAPHLLPV